MSGWESWNAGIPRAAPGLVARAALRRCMAAVEAESVAARGSLGFGSALPPLPPRVAT